MIQKETIGLGMQFIGNRIQKSYSEFLFKIIKCSTLHEMELLEINLTKDWGIFLHAIHSPFYWQGQFG
jgi:hypothetical protein